MIFLWLIILPEHLVVVCDRDIRHVVYHVWPGVHVRQAAQPTVAVEPWNPVLPGSRHIDGRQISPPLSCRLLEQVIGHLRKGKIHQLLSYFSKSCSLHTQWTLIILNLLYVIFLSMALAQVLNKGSDFIGSHLETWRD